MEYKASKVATTSISFLNKEYMNEESNGLEVETLQISGTLKAISLSFCRLVADYPSLLLELFDASIASILQKELYEYLLIPENKACFLKKVNMTANSTDWTYLEQTYISWGKFGWVFTPKISIEEWDACPATQIEADRKILKSYNTNDLQEDIFYTYRYTSDSALFSESVNCFKHHYYRACASLLCSLIDAYLIQQQYLSKFQNIKTGKVAIERLNQAKSISENYERTNRFDFIHLNFMSFLNMLFEPANGFLHEPSRINRNYLFHGMSKRKVLRKDCIKLFIAYKQLLYFWSNSIF